MNLSLRIDIDSHHSNIDHEALLKRLVKIVSVQVPFDINFNGILFKDCFPNEITSFSNNKVVELSFKFNMLELGKENVSTVQFLTNIATSLRNAVGSDSPRRILVDTANAIDKELAKPTSKPVAWQFRTFYNEDTVTPGWSEWEDCTELKFNEVSEYVAKGFYQTRALYTSAD